MDFDYEVFLKHSRSIISNGRLSRRVIMAANLLVLVCIADLPSLTSQELAIQTDSLRAIPKELQSSLVDRLRAFIIAQRDDQWDQVSSLLGNIRKSGYRDAVYTPKHKRCYIEQLKSSSTIRFTLTSIYFSTAILSLPMNRKWWYLEGEAEFAGKYAPGNRRTTFIAYRDSGEWFFTPGNYDEAWVRGFLTEKELKADYSKELLIKTDSTCPLLVTDLSVKIDPRQLSSRIVDFNFHNRSNKTVTGLGYEIGSVSGGTSTGRPFRIPPGQTVPAKKDLKYSAYQYYCEGELPHIFRINFVSFEDGTVWWDPSRKKQ
jgi:hypothetical protein